MDWSDNWRDAFRIELRAEAVGLAWRGWPIMPGTYPTAQGWSDGDRVYTGGPEPVNADWHLQLAEMPERVATMWTGRPYSLLVATGTVLDAVEVPGSFGLHLAKLLRAVGLLAPIAATPEGRWMFLTTPDDAALADLDAHPDLVVHGEGSWIPLPPSAGQHGIVHWRVKPQNCGWQLAEAGTVRDAVARVLDAAAYPTTAAEHAEDQLLATQRLSA